MNRIHLVLFKTALVALFALVLLFGIFHEPLHAQAPLDAPTTRIAVTDGAFASSFKKIVAGNDHTCGLTTDGALQCWGDNADGQVGDGSDFPSRPPVTVSGLGSGVLDAATGGNHSCAILSSGTVQCWGRNSSGQLGDGTTDERLLPVAVLGLPATPTALAAGEAHTCALFATGAVSCWGRNAAGQLGNGATADSSTPVAVSGLAAGALEIVAGFDYSCARLANGTVQCWGGNGDGQLGNGSQTSSPFPVTVTGLSRAAVALATGFYHTCAALQDGDVECWGDNARGQLGDGTRDDQPAPVAVQALSDDIARLAAGRYHTCALAIDGDVHCWGSSSRGQLGAGSLESSRTPLRVTGLGTDAIALAAGEEHSCAILTSGALRCWGSNRDRQLGDGAPGLYSIPQLLIPNRLAGATTPYATFLQLALGRYHSCAVFPRGTLHCWGRNSDGQLGDGTVEPRTLPVAVLGMESGVRQLTLGAEHSCALKSSGQVFCWGSNQYGQLGDGSAAQRVIPALVNGLAANVDALLAGDNHTCALSQAGGGTLQCWGSNARGQLGNGTTDDSPIPVTVFGLTGAQAAEAGLAHTCAALTNGVRCWGDNESGQLGDGSRNNHTAPVAVAGLPTGAISAFAVGDRHSCAAVDGVAYCWGNNRDGQLGDGTLTDSPSPVMVQGISGSVAELAAGASHSCARTTNGALYCWGGNEQSQLGDGTTEDRPTAALVSGLAANVQQVIAGGYHTCVLVTGNRPLCWGNDSDGQLATGVLAQSTLPIALGTPPAIRLDVNTLEGKPGSTFTLIGSGFAPTSTLPVVVNGVTLSATVASNETGGFILYLTTDSVSAGSYAVAIGRAPALTHVFFLQSRSPLRRPEGAGQTLALPTDLAELIFNRYLPLLRR